MVVHMQYFMNNIYHYQQMVYYDFNKHINFYPLIPITYLTHVCIVRLHV